MQSFEWVAIIPGISAIPVHVTHAAIVFMILTLLIMVAYRRLANPALDIVPEPRLSVVNFFEAAYGTIEKLCEESLGHHGHRYIYLVGTLALWILFSNLLGVIPGFVPPTDNVNTNFACAAIVFLATHYYGFKTHGAKYLKHFVGPTPWLAPLMIPIELIGHLARPLSLTLRLFGNMFGDHMNLMVFVGMMIALAKAYVFVAPVAVLVPIVIICLGIFVSVVQAYVFVLLTMSYLSGSLAESH
jgi:F-type H+-transporting ATPase subunit a